MTLLVSAEYHDGYLSIYFNNGNFHEISKQLSPIQEEAIWYVLSSSVQWLCLMSQDLHVFGPTASIDGCS